MIAPDVIFAGQRDHQPVPPSSSSSSFVLRPRRVLLSNEAGTRGRGRRTKDEAGSRRREWEMEGASTGLSQGVVTLRACTLSGLMVVVSIMCILQTISIHGILRQIHTNPPTKAL